MGVTSPWKAQILTHMQKIHSNSSENWHCNNNNKKTMNTSTISFCGTTLFKHEHLTHLDIEYDSEALDSDSQETQKFHRLGQWFGNTAETSHPETQCPKELICLTLWAKQKTILRPQALDWVHSLHPLLLANLRDLASSEKIQSRHLTSCHKES